MVISYQGKFSFAILDMTRSFIDRSPTSPLDFQNGDLSSIVQNRYTFAGFLASIIFYVFAVTFVAISIPNSNHRSTFFAPAAAFAIVSAAACIYGVESLKMQIIEDGRSGGTLAFLANGFVSSTITTGTGAYLVLAAGIIALVFNYVKGQFTSGTSYLTAQEQPEIAPDINLDFPKDAPKVVEKEGIQETAPQHAPQPQSINRIVYKSSGTAALLAFIGAIFGLPGIGHIYVGRIGRGLLILVGGFILYILSWLTIFAGILTGGLAGSASIIQGGVAMGIFFLLSYLTLLVWQIFNARSLAKKLNEQVQLTGKEPW